MANTTIRKLEEITKIKLPVRAAMHRRSMQQEAREILRNALNQGEKAAQRPRHTAKT
jgi:antitoxin FitA